MSKDFVAKRIKLLYYFPNTLSVIYFVDFPD